MRTFVIACGVVLTLAIPARATDAGIVSRITRTYWPKHFLVWSPDGTHLFYSRHYPHRRHSQQILTGLRVVRADGTNDRPLMPAFDRSVQIQEHPAFAPDGKTLYLTGGGDDVGNAAKDAFVCQVTEDFRGLDLKKRIPGPGVTLGEQPVPSPDGRQLAFCAYGRSMHLADIDGKNKRVLLQSSGQYLFQPAWSPDGEWVAFASDREGDVEIYKIRVDGSDLTRLTRSPGVDCRPRWSRDGRWLLFTSNRGGNEDLYLMRADGSDVRRLTDHPAPDDHAAWSPDGKRIAFVSMRDGGFDLYTIAMPAGLVIGQAPIPIARTRNTAKKALEGLIVHHDFDNDEGESIYDRVTGRRSMTLTGARLAGPPGRRALSLEAMGDIASAGNAESLQHEGALTFSLWVKPTKVESNGYLMSKYAWNLYLGSDFHPRFETRSASDREWETLAARAPALPDRWTYLVCVFDPIRKQKRIFLDGKLSAEGGRTGETLGGTKGYPLELGRYVAGQSQQYHGLVDEVRVYAGVLEAKTIAEEYVRQRKKVMGE